MNEIGRLDVREAPAFSKPQIRYLEHVVFNRIQALLLAIEATVKRLNNINADVKCDMERIQNLFADLIVKAHYEGDRS